MKRSILWILCLAAMLLFCSCIPAQLESVSSAAGQSAASRPGESQGGSLSSEPSPEGNGSGGTGLGSNDPLSYEEYFSEIRPVDTLSSISFYYLDQDTGTLYQKKGENPRGIQLAEHVSSYAGTTTGVMYYTEDGMLYGFKSGKDRQPVLLYEDPEKELHSIRASADLVFFALGTRLYRIYLPTGRMDFLCDTYYDNSQDPYVPWREYGGECEYRVISNHEIEYLVMHSGFHQEIAERLGVSVEDYIENERGSFGAFVTYNSLTGEYSGSKDALEFLGLTE